MSNASNVRVQKWTRVTIVTGPVSLDTKHNPLLIIPRKKNCQSIHYFMPYNIIYYTHVRLDSI